MAHQIDLGRIALINENIKEIIRTSERVYVIALNAMFMSRKTHEGVGGFSAVTSQLRDFSAKLNKNMSEMRHQIATIVRLVAEQSRRHHRHRLLVKATQNAASRHARHGESAISDIDAELNAAIRRFSNHMNKALSLIGIGQNLVVLAKVEANGAGDLSRVLAEIANDMAGTIEQIESLVRQGQQQIAA